MKVVTVIGTRPEIIRLARVMPALDRFTTHVIVHTGQNYDYGLNQVFFDDLELRPPDVFLEAAGDTAAQTIAQVIARTDEVLANERPDALLILGDTNSCLAVIAAKRRKIPVFHMEAGNRCFDQRVPEEINRRIVDHIADINMPYSAIARGYLIAEGIPADRVITTGSPMYEVLHHYMPKIQASQALAQLGLTADEYYMVSCHREENVDVPDQLAKLAEVLNGLAALHGLPVVVSTHPRTRKRIGEHRIELHDGVQLLPPQSFSDYVHLQMRARATLSDSGTITEESSILNFPALNIREAHERPEGMEEASVMMVGLNWSRVQSGLRVLETQGRDADRMLRMPVDYQVPNVSDKVVRIILSYTDYVNRVVWQRS